MTRRTSQELWDTYCAAQTRARETLSFEDAEIARKAWSEFVRSEDGPVYSVRSGTNVIDLEARRERHS